MVNLKNRNILVTGGTGFVGSHLVEALIKEKAKVFVADINFDKKLYFFTAGLDKRSTVIDLDICDYQKLSSLIKKNRIEFIFHLAALSTVNIGYDDPKRTLINNIVSTINVLEVVRLNKNIKEVIVASSDKAYGEKQYQISNIKYQKYKKFSKEKIKYKESDPLAGDHPYEVSKSTTDLIATTYYKTYKTPAVITRFGNIYGEGDLNFSRIIPDIMRCLINGYELKIRSDGTYVRDYLYVKDVVNGYLLLAKNIEKVYGEAFNFGSRETLSVLELVNLIERTLNKKISYQILNIAQNEIPYQSLDWSKIKKTLGWQPKYSIKKTIKKIYRWYKKYYEI